MNIKDLYKLFASVIICQGAGIIGSLFTAGSVSTWYVTLSKPALNPPSWVFGPVWGTLYLLMGISLFLVWKNGFKKKHERTARNVFIIQLVLNSLWSISFFGLENPGLALVNIIVLWIAILAIIIYFYRISKPAALLLIPYLLWVSFATYLNYSIWVLNSF